MAFLKSLKAEKKKISQTHFRRRHHYRRRRHPRHLGGRLILMRFDSLLSKLLYPIEALVTNLATAYQGLTQAILPKKKFLLQVWFELLPVKLLHLKRIRRYGFEQLYFIRSYIQK